MQRDVLMSEIKAQYRLIVGEIVLHAAGVRLHVNFQTPVRRPLQPLTETKNLIGVSAAVIWPRAR